MDYVVALGAPCHVVRVTKGVDLEGTDVGGEEDEVLCRRGEHVPGIEIEEGHEEVESYGGGGGYDHVCENVVAELEGFGVVRELTDDDKECGKCGVRHDDTIDDHGGKIESLGSLWSVAHREDELRADE